MNFSFSCFLKNLSFNVLNGYIGAKVNTYFDTRFATSGSVVAVSGAVRTVFDHGIREFLKYQCPDSSLEFRVRIYDLSFALGPLIATQMEFPIEPKHDVLQHLTGWLISTASLGVIAEAVESIQDRLVGSGLVAAEKMKEVDGEIRQFFKPFIVPEGGW